MGYLTTFALVQFLLPLYSSLHAATSSMKTCDHSSIVNCINNGTTTQRTTTTTVAVEEESREIIYLPNGCPADFDVYLLLPHETICNRFYYCVHGEKVERECAPGTLFNPAIMNCDHAWAVDCQDVTTECICDNSEEDCDGSSTTTVKPESAEKEDSGEKSESAQKEDSKENDESGEIDESAEKKESNEEESPEKEESDEREDSAEKEPSNEKEDSAEKEQSNEKEDSAEKEQSNEKEDSAEKNESAEKEESEEKKESGENGGSSCENSESGEGGDPSECNCAGEDSEEVEDLRCKEDCHVPHWAHESDCDKFWRCVGEEKVLGVCSEGLHFNEKTQTCDFICNAGCKRHEVQSTAHRDGLKLFLPWDKVNDLFKDSSLSVKKFIKKRN